MWESHFDGLCGFRQGAVSRAICYSCCCHQEGIWYCDTLCSSFGHILLPLLWLWVFVLFCEGATSDSSHEFKTWRIVIRCHVVTSGIYARLLLCLLMSDAGLVWYEFTDVCRDFTLLCRWWKRLISPKRRWICTSLQYIVSLYLPSWECLGHVTCFKVGR